MTASGLSDHLKPVIAADNRFESFPEKRVIINNDDIFLFSHVLSPYMELQ
jgi:hypothetical protein